MAILKVIRIPGEPNELDIGFNKPSSPASSCYPKKKEKIIIWYVFYIYIHVVIKYLYILKIKWGFHILLSSASIASSL